MTTHGDKPTCWTIRPIGLLLLFSIFVAPTESAAQNPGSVSDSGGGQEPLWSFLYGRSGFGFYSASVSGGYFTLGAPGSFGSPQGSDMVLNGSLTMGWSNRGERTRAAFRYSPSYMTYPKTPELSSSGHMFSFSLDRRIRRSWNFVFGTVAQYSSIEQFLFAPSTFQLAASLPATIDDLSNALLRTTFTTEQLATMLSGAPVADVPSRQLLFGNSLLNVMSNVSLTYTKSTRTTFTVQAFAVRTQPVSAERDIGSERIRDMRTTSGNISATLSYSLTPRTNVGVNVSESRTFSVVQDVYNSSFSGLIGRRMGQRWSVQVSAGAGVMRPVRETYRLPTGVQYQGSGSLAYKAGSHTLLFSTTRSFGDSFGLGAMSTISGAAAWNWAHPRRSWSISASATQQWFRGVFPGNFGSAQGNVSISRALNSQLSLSGSYALVQNFGQIPLPTRTIHSALASLTWSPFTRRMVR